MRLTVTPNTLVQLRAENDALRQRLAYLEAQLHAARQPQANADHAPRLPGSLPYSWEID